MFNKTTLAACPGYTGERQGAGKPSTGRFLESTRGERVAAHAREVVVVRM